MIAEPVFKPLPKSAARIARYYTGSEAWRAADLDDLRRWFSLLTDAQLADWYPGCTRQDIEDAIARRETHGWPEDVFQGRGPVPFVMRLYGNPRTITRYPGLTTRCGDHWKRHDRECSTCQ